MSACGCVIDESGALMAECEACERLGVASVVDLRDRLEPWVTWWRTCLDCGAAHVSVEQPGTVALAECPKCGQPRAARTAPAD